MIVVFLVINSIIDFPEGASLFDQTVSNSRAHAHRLKYQTSPSCALLYRNLSPQVKKNNNSRKIAATRKAEGVLEWKKDARRGECDYRSCGRWCW